MTNTENVLVVGEWTYNLSAGIVAAALMALPAPKEVTIATLPKRTVGERTPRQVAAYKRSIEVACYGRSFGR